MVFESSVCPESFSRSLPARPPVRGVVIAGLCMQEDRFEPTFGILKEIDLIFSQYYMSSQGLQVAQIASGLGYSEQSSYTRACRRWFGVSPRQLVARLRSSENEALVGR